MSTSGLNTAGSNTQFMFAENYDFNNPRGVFSRSKLEVEAEPTHYPTVGEDIILFAHLDGEAFGIVVRVTEVSEVDDIVVYKTDYPERTWRKGRFNGNSV